MVIFQAISLPMNYLSRVVALWKHIKALNKLGYIIESSRKGYKFISSPDLLIPYEFDNWQHNLSILMK